MLSLHCTFLFSFFFLYFFVSFQNEYIFYFIFCDRFPSHTHIKMIYVNTRLTKFVAFVYGQQITNLLALYCYFLLNLRLDATNFHFLCLCNLYHQSYVAIFFCFLRGYTIVHDYRIHWWITNTEITQPPRLVHENGIIPKVNNSNHQTNNT